MMVINYPGRKSGKNYRIPIGYKRERDMLLTTSYKHRKWWRNLRGGVPVTLRLQGRDVSGLAEVIEDEAGVAEGMKTFIAGSPRTARMFGIKLGEDGQPELESLKQAADGRVIVRTRLY
jgi:hypothetical protein